jgi:hypothetical protein
MLVLPKIHDIPNFDMIFALNVEITWQDTRGKKRPLYKFFSVYDVHSGERSRDETPGPVAVQSLAAESRFVSQFFLSFF